MVKYILVSRNVFFDEYNEIRDEVKSLYDKIDDEKIRLVLVSRNLADYRKKIIDCFGEGKILLRKRVDLSGKFIEASTNVTNKDFIMLGAVEEDIRIVANNKIILFNPSWITVDEKIEKYGFKVDSIETLYQCINILNLQKGFMFDTKIDDITTLITLCDAREYYAVNDELEMLKRYKGVLKYKNNKYQHAVYFHYLCNLFNDARFSDIDYWMAVPSSSGENDNYIYEMVKNTRYILNNRSSKDLFIRHTKAPKSTYLSAQQRLDQGCKRHLDTIHLNPEYRKKLKGKKICIIDDYVTNGTSFESLRNILKDLEVKEIIFLAIGTFQKPYIKEEYKIVGNVFNSGFTFEKQETYKVYPQANQEAQNRIIEIYNIIK